ncbi:PepSY domain-containing protein [Virgibacillus halodenitrificans]|uniref:PepSY domain-containing protein n=1 Tax=Virgibacillus halodenitrificans TaxID=1482 RepID=A0ABR7VML3_VIRHA|nr:PepSY domain-containing protein [Virgibacillus halodenitrificans]MBD1223139.1 PepSY domain-containing protein [Virgibacillus halodenitrificans]
MKSKIAVVAGALTGAAFLGLGIYHSDASQTEPKISTDDIKTMVADQYPGTITDIELEKNFDKIFYEVEVENENREYDLKLDANTGEVLKIREKDTSDKESVSEKKTEASDGDKEKQESTKEQQHAQENKQAHDSKEQKNDDKQPVEKEKNKQPNGLIGMKKAEKIALDAFAGTIVSMELDEDDDRMIYEIEIENGEDEADVDIDAYTGEVLGLSIDRDN